MERIALFLPSKPQPALVRYGWTTIIVAVSCAAEYGFSEMTGDLSLFLFFPAVYFAGIAFDGGSGILAAFLATAFATWQVRDDLMHHALSLTIAFLMGVFIAVTSEAFRKLLDKALMSGRGKELMLDELAHRVKNNLAMVSSLLLLQARKKPEIREEFEDAASRVRTIADVHDFLRSRPAGDSVDLANYLRELCIKLGDTLRGVRPIAVNVEAQHIEVPATVAAPIGIIVNELVTNSLKYAFPNEGSGLVRVTCEERDGLTVTVEDNGIGLVGTPAGMGSTLVTLMANQIQGVLTQEDARPGLRTTLKIKL